jgi:5-(aminomethyl)-3-furanmethanol phosphate kinase
MWVVKLGGSLGTDTLLPQWLDLLVQLGGGRVTVVGGGGGFADEARRLQTHWQFNDLAAHNMAVLAMAQTAYQLQALNPGLQLATRKSDIRRVLHSGHTALWLPFELQRDTADTSTHWGHTSDSIALDLARKLNAERLVLVKSCSIDPALSLGDLGRAGVVDTGFATLSEGAAFPIHLLHKDNLAGMRALLLDEGRYPGV